MLDLISHFETAAEPALEEFKENYEDDKICIECLRSPSGAGREITLIKWLKSYGVLQGIKEAQRVDVAACILDCADNIPFLKTIGSFKDLQVAYSCFYTHISKALPGNINGNDRDVSSLASKALWCLSPGFVPILDDYAQRTLWILGRLYQIYPNVPYEDSHSRYLQFADIWFQISERTGFRAISDQAFTKIDWAPFDMTQDVAFTRGFDKVLWIMGQKRFAHDDRANIRPSPKTGRKTKKPKSGTTSRSGGPA